MPTTYQIALKVNFDANGGSGAPSSVRNPKVSGYAAVSDIPATLSVTIPTDKPTRTYYTFQGWSASSGATSASYAAGGSYSHTFYDVLYGQPTEYVAKLYAVWSHQTAYVNYDANGGSGAPAQQSHWAGYSVTLSSTKPTRDGYTFLGWAESSSATTATYQPGETCALYTTTTLYAVWEAIATYVAYIKVGGAWKQADVYVKVSGAWKQSSQAYVKVSGAWKST